MFECCDIPSIAQLVERRTVVVTTEILRSLVQIRLEGVNFECLSLRSKILFNYNQELVYCR